MRVLLVLTQFFLETFTFGISRIKKLGQTDLKDHNYFLGRSHGTEIITGLQNYYVLYIYVYIRIHIELATILSRHISNEAGVDSATRLRVFWVNARVIK